jgi:inosine-uridine nucleoside N-ribohydrolase
VRLWIDSDVGDDPDDVVALLCAAAHDDVDLVGVSIVPDTPIERPELAGELVDAPVHPGGDPAAMIEAFRRAAPDALLAIGPLANVAALLDAGVDVPELTVMGGVLTPLRHRGRVFEAEHNFATHPDAAARVVAGSGATLVPLDVTVGMRVVPADLDRLTGTVPLLGREVAEWFDRRRAGGAPADELALILHDPLALLVCLGDVDAQREARALTVDASSGVVRADDAGRVHEVVTRVDAPRAIARVVELIGA